MELTLADAKSIIEHTLRAQKENGFKPMAVAVLNASGI
jgi:uncharacterized protein GlcG (DUF336 family)